MVDAQNWRTEVDAVDYLGHQKKATNLSDRRPAIRKPSDMPAMGPAIAAAALSVSNWNDVIATYDGYYSSARAANGPRPEISGVDLGYDIHEYVGYVVTDSAMGGVQVLTDLDTGSEYLRTFLRAPSDPSSVTWSPWGARHRIPPTAFAQTTFAVVAQEGIYTSLTAPTLNGVNFEETYSSDGYLVSILEQGVYTGLVEITVGNLGGGASGSELVLSVPRMGTSETIIVPGTRAAFTFINTKDTPADMTLTAQQFNTNNTDQNITWKRLDITRIGDAI